MLRIFALFLCVFLSACANKSAALQESVENYMKALRRGDPKIALSYVNPDKRTELARTLERIDQDLMLSNIEIQSVVPDEKMESALVVFMMEYFDQRSSDLFVTKSSSLWKYDEKIKAWLLDSSTPLVTR